MRLRKIRIDAKINNIVTLSLVNVIISSHPPLRFKMRDQSIYVLNHQESVRNWIIKKNRKICLKAIN